MARREANHYTDNKTVEPLELDLEEIDPKTSKPKFVTFKDPDRLTVDELEEMATGDPKTSLRLLLDDQFDVFWGEWSKRPWPEVRALAEDVNKFFQDQHE